MPEEMIRVTDEMVDEALRKTAELDREMIKQDGFDEGFKTGILKCIWWLKEDISNMEKLERQYREHEYPMRLFSFQKEINKNKKVIQFLKTCFKYENIDFGEG